MLYTQSVLQVGATEKFPYALSFESLDPFLQGQQVGSMFHSRRGGDKRLAEFELTCKVDGVAPQILFSLAISAIAGAILIRTSAGQVPSLHRFQVPETGHLL